MSVSDVDLTALTISHRVIGLNLESNEAGHGAYGVVYRVTVAGRECIAKKLHTILLQADNYLPNPTTQQKEFIVEKFRNECRILSTLKHPNIVGFVGVHFGRDRSDISLVMERLHTDVAAFVEKNPNTPLLQRISILYDVSKGLHYLHSLTPPLIHRDLTAFNVLLTVDLTAKIADLGVSRYIDPSMAQMVKLSVNPGHLVYMPPESKVKNPVYTTKLDIFSFGNLVLHTINGKLPSMYDLSLNELIKLTPEGKVELVKRNDSVHERMNEKHSLYSLVAHCLQDRPEGRPAVEEVSATLKELNERYSRENFLDACKRGDMDSVLMLLRDGEYVNQKDENERSGLHYSSYRGHVEVVTCLLETKVDHHSQDKSGWTALHAAAHKGHLRVIEKLLDAKADVNIKTNDEETALHLACKKGYTEVVKVLLAAKATVNTQNKKNVTALHSASKRGHTEVVRILLDAKATVNTQDKTGESPLMPASFNDHQKVVEMLIRAGANVNVQDEGGVTALQLVAHEGHLRVVEMLLEANADINIKNNDGDNAYELATKKGHKQICEKLHMWTL